MLPATTTFTLSASYYVPCPANQTTAPSCPSVPQPSGTTQHVQAQPDHSASDLLQPNIPPTLPALLKPTHTILVDSARYEPLHHEPPDHYVDDDIRDFYNALNDDEETVESDDITLVTDT